MISACASLPRRATMSFQGCVFAPVGAQRAASRALARRLLVDGRGAVEDAGAPALGEHVEDRGVGGGGAVEDVGHGVS